MVVNDLNLVRRTARPAKAEPPLIVNADTVLTGAIAFELLKPVAGRHAQIIERLGGVQGNQLPEHSAPKVGWISADRLPVKEAGGIPVAEALDHRSKLTPRVSNGKRYYVR